MSRFYDAPVPAGSVALYWLGQAGFLLKAADGRTVMIDPYLSNCCERFFGFRRLMAPTLSPTELLPDVLLITHAHYDHLDIDSVPALMAAGPTQMWCAQDVRGEAAKLGLSTERITYLHPGDVQVNDWLRVTAIACDHGEPAPDALGFLIELDGKRIYLAGDTAFRPDIFAQECLRNVDVFIAPINGAFGNLNEQQAADAARLVAPGTTVPCHFWNFAEHRGDPILFMNAMQERGLHYTLLQAAGAPLLI